MSPPQASDSLEAQAKTLPPIGREARYWELVEDIIEIAKEVHHERELAASRAFMNAECAKNIVKLVKLPRASRTEQIADYFEDLVDDEARELYFSMCKVVDALGFFIEQKHKSTGKDSEKHAAFLLVVYEYLRPLSQLQVAWEENSTT